MDIPEILLQRLKCSVCEGYLSCGPIYIVENEKAICGRCSNDFIKSSKILENNLKARNFQYEELASIFQFPCRFALFGCPEKIVFSEVQDYPHELSCLYKPYNCPIFLNNQCNWCGPWISLIEHCQQSHPDNILENPYSSEPNFGADSSGTYVIPCFHTLFILRIHISVMSERIIYSLYLLDDPSKIALYNFAVDCKRNHLSFTKPGKIGTVENFVKHMPFTCIINHSTLLMKVGGVAGTTFTINIKQLSTRTKCKFCPTEIEANHANDWACNLCVAKLQYCQNKVDKCAFMDVALQKVKKHERYFCKHVSKCFDCAGTITAGKVFQHFDNDHENTIVSKAEMVWKAIETPKRILNFVLLSSRLIDKFFCKYYLDARQFSLILCTKYSSDQLRLYTCKIEIIDRLTKYHETFQPVPVSDFFWDWRIDIDFDDITRNEPVQFEVKIIFEKADILP